MLGMAFYFLVNFSGMDGCNFFPNFQCFREVELSSEHGSLASYGCEVVPGRVAPGRNDGLGTRHQYNPKWYGCSRRQLFR